MEYIAFGELYAEPSSNGVSKPSGIRGDGIEMIGMGELFAHDIIDDMMMERVPMTEREMNKYIIYADDLLFARQSMVAEGAGKCSIVRALIRKTTFESHLIRVRLDKTRCNPWYYFYLFSLKNNPVKTIINQCAQAGIRAKELEKLKVPYIAKEKQDRIVSVLMLYDNLIKNNQKRIKLLEQMAQRLYQEWFVRFRFPGYEKAKFVDGIPQGWEYGRLSEVLSLLDSKRIPLSSMERDTMEPNYPYYGAAGQLGFVEDYIFDGTYLLLGEDGSVITEDGYPYLQYVWGKFWVNNHAHIIEQRGNYSVEFLYCMFKKMNVQSIVTGVAQPKISQGRLFMKKVLLPSDIVLKVFNGKIQPLFSQIKVLTEQNKNLTKQRDLLLPRLMSGKLAV